VTGACKEKGNGLGKKEEGLEERNIGQIQEEYDLHRAGIQTGKKVRPSAAEKEETEKKGRIRDSGSGKHRRGEGGNRK